MAQLAALHKVNPDLEKAGLIDENDPTPPCFNGQKKLLGSSEHLGYITTYQLSGDKLCVKFHNESTNHEHIHCSSNEDPYYIKLAGCVYKKGGMRRMNKSITRRLRLGAARRRTRQRRGNKSVKSRRR